MDFDRVRMGVCLPLFGGDVCVREGGSGRGEKSGEDLNKNHSNMLMSQRHYIFSYSRTVNSVIV